MRKTIMYTQENWPVNSVEHTPVGVDGSKRNAISRAAVAVAEEVGATAIIAETTSGATASNIAKMRPHLPICAVTSSSRTAQQLALTYATRSFVRPDGEKAGLELARELQTEHYFGDIDSMIAVIVSGKQPGVVGGTDTVRVRVIE